MIRPHLVAFVAGITACAATSGCLVPYLQTKKSAFSQVYRIDLERTAFADFVQIGRNHNSWPFCSGTTINVAFIFAGTDKFPLGPHPYDTLKTIKLFAQAEDCL